MYETADANGLFFQVAPDLTVRRTVVAVARVLNEDGATPVALTGTAGADDARIAIVTGDGLLAAAADLDALPDPLNPPAFGITVDEPGFRPAAAAVAFAPDPVLPLALPDLVLRRVPATLGGRVVSAASDAPIPGATVTLAPSPALVGQQPVALGQALASDVPAGTALQGFPLAAVGGPLPVKTVLQSVPAGGAWLVLDDRRNLAAGQILRLGPPDRPSLARIGTVASAPADLTQPGLVLLATPLTATARAGDPAQAFTAGAPAGPAVAATGDAFAGETLLLAPSAPAGDALVVGPPATGVPYTAPPASDADGYYSRGGIARFARFDVTAAAPGFTPQTRAWIPQPGASRIDWRLTP